MSNSKLVRETFTIYLQNKCRQRRNLSKIIMQWDILQTRVMKSLRLYKSKSLLTVLFKPSHCFDQNSTLNSNLSLWCYIIRLGLMVEMLQIGFDLNLYANYEILSTLL